MTRPIRTDFLRRVRKELSINVEGLREIIVTLSERVNRKVQVLKLHWQASRLSDQIDAVYRQVGQQIDARVSPGDRRLGDPLPREGLGTALTAAVTQLAGLRRELLRVDGLVRELEADALREDLLQLQQDLGTRGLVLERLPIAARSPVVGRRIADLGLPAGLRVVAVLRGPTVIEPAARTPLRQGDVLVWLGRPADVRLGQRLVAPGS